MSNVIEFSIKALDDFSANMNKLDRQLGSLRTAFQAFGGAIGAYALVSFSEKLIAAVDESDKASIKLNKILENTGYAAGTSRLEIEGYVDALERTTRFDDEGIRNASSELLKFGYIAHDTFKNALSVAADFAAFSGSSIEAAAQQLGRAMANPEQASRLLLKAGVDLSEAQKEQIKLFEEVGDKAGSQAIILGELQRVYGGLAAEMNGTLGGALAHTKKAWDELMEGLGGNAVIGGAIRSSLEGIAAAINILRANIEHIAILFQALSVAATVFVGLKIAEVVLAIAGSFTVASFSIAGATAAMRAFMLTNPIGWVTLAVGLGVLAWDEWKHAAESATKEAEKGLSQVVEVLDRWEKIIGESQAKKKIENTALAFKALKDAAEAYAPVFESLVSTLKNSETPYDAHIRRLKEIDDLQKLLGGSSDELAAAIQRENESWGSTVAQITGVNQSLTEHEASLRKIQEVRGELTDGQFAEAMDQENERWQKAQAAVEWYGVSVASVAKGIGDAMAQTVVDGASLAKGLENVAKTVLRTVISTLVQIGVQRLILSALDHGATAALSSQKMAAGMGEVFVNSFASAAAIPMVGWAIAPQVAAANTAIAMAGAATSMASGAGLGGIAHGGLDFVPSESTFLLDKGERVLSPRQNEDLTGFLAEGGSGQSVVIQSLTIHVLENATSADTFTRMDKIQLRNSLGQPVVDALNEMFSLGIRPNFAMQNNR